MRHDLLGPLMDQEWRCAPFARREGLDPIGSAGTYDCVLLVEWPLPWPRDIGEIPELAAAMRGAAEAAPERSIRVFAVVAPGDDPATEGGSIRVARWWRAAGEPAGRYSGSDHVVPGPGLQLADGIAALVGPDAPLGEPAPRDVIICGHGRRDVCCGRAGTLLCDAVAGRWPGVRVRRCSHTGGHRFAPTAFVFPEARGWAYLDEDVLDGIVHRSGDVGALGPHYRGWLALDAPAQVVERALFVEHGWGWLDATVEASALAGIDPDAGAGGVAIDWQLHGGGGRAEAAVGIRRRVPTLACGSPPDASTKTDPEYELRHLTRP